MMRISVFSLLVVSLLLVPLTAAVGSKSALARQAEVALGEVTIELNGMPYREVDVLSAALKSGLRQTIWGMNGQTDCSIVTLEQWTGTAWKPLPGCTSGLPLVPVPIEPGRSYAIQIDPRSLNLVRLAVNSLLAFGQGSYRIAFGYRLTRDFNPPGHFFDSVAYSQTFQISPR